MDLDLNALEGKLNAVAEMPQDERFTLRPSSSLASTILDPMPMPSLLDRPEPTAEEQAARDARTELIRTFTWGDKATREANAAKEDKQIEDLRNFDLSFGYEEDYQVTSAELSQRRIEEEGARDLQAGWTIKDQLLSEYDRAKGDYTTFAKQVAIVAASDQDMESEATLRKRVRVFKSLTTTYDGLRQESFKRIQAAIEKIEERDRIALENRVEEGDSEAEGEAVGKSKAAATKGRGRAKKVEAKPSAGSATKGQVGRPKKADVSSSAGVRKTRGPGRPRKVLDTPVIPPPKSGRPERPPKKPAVASVAQPKTRGRPKKNDAAEATSVATPQARGRPKKSEAANVVVAPAKTRGQPKKSDVTNVATVDQPMTRGRPEKTQDAPAAAKSDPATPPKAKRGRPANSGPENPLRRSLRRSSDVSAASPAAKPQGVTKRQTAVATRGRGRPRKA